MAPGWEHIDFVPLAPGVKRVNLLAGFPYPDNTFDAVYSSHVMEHFSRDEGRRVLQACHRILKPGGILRVVVPDLEQNCREYLRLLDEAATKPEAARQYDWVILEMLDQMVRDKPSGYMQSFLADLQARNDHAMMAYVKSRTQDNIWDTAWQQIRRTGVSGITPGKVLSKLQRIYVDLILRLVPPAIRKLMVDGTPPGEKHRWMYDRYSLIRLMEQVGYRDARLVNAHESAIPGFADDHLDVNPDGMPYKNISLYGEAVKPV